MKPLPIRVLPKEETSLLEDREEAISKGETEYGTLLQKRGGTGFFPIKIPTGKCSYPRDLREKAYRESGIKIPFYREATIWYKIPATLTRI